jgi:RHH-type proline utilization regulon transcriptional repressor/proline dehydrogenase/delta 1-pyrroline-5-carboxylate dehydrogenase
VVSGLAGEVAELTEELERLSDTRKVRPFGGEWWNDRLLGWSMSHPSFKTQLFRFVDVFPAANGDDREVLRHLAEYLALAEVPRLVDLGLDLAEQLPLGGAISAAVSRRAITRMARQFIVGTTPEEVVGALGAMWASGVASTVDVLGEKTLTAADADRYAERVGELASALVRAAPAWTPNALLDFDDLGAVPRVNLSVKPTALSPHLHPLAGDLGIAQAKARLWPILRLARDTGALVHLDMEQYEVRDLTIELLESILDEPELADLHTGITVQAYLRDAVGDLERIIARSAARRTPVLVRLVKGAYWDTETAHATAAGWPVPVYGDKAESDANFERGARLLHEHHGAVRAAFGSHNLASLAYAIACARELGIPDNGYEIQMLYGMGEPFHDAVRQLGLRLRVYAPTGEIVPGMAYLVRRLLENTANESFVNAHLRLHSGGGQPAPSPNGDHARSTAPPGRRNAPTPYEPEPVIEWHRRERRRAFADAIASAESAGLGGAVPGVIDGKPIFTTGGIDSVDPADPGRLVARSAECGTDHAAAAIEVARQALPAWQRTPPEERAAVLFRAAQWLRERRFEIAALEVFEAGKPWPEADADVCEAIDYCEYYGREILRYALGAAVQSPPGEENAVVYRPRGVAVVIAPWNFPLAIPTGMVTAALVAGNTVILKPAEQAPLVASKLVEALRASGLPDGVLGFLPGRGEVIGEFLVRHRDVALVAFTGSKAVGLGIIEAAAIHQPGQQRVKKVVVEMGGKNAIVIDADADLDQAVPITIRSAFGYSGQKCSACSRVIVVGSLYDAFVDRLVGAARELQIGHPRSEGIEIGPLIDDEAYRRVRTYVSEAGASGDVVLAREDLPTDGWFVGPTIVGHVRPGTPLATEEIFGPVLAVMSADSLDEAIAMANDTAYGLTAGIVSRSPAHIARATAELTAGSIYVNRPITGAIVGRHPFGGFGLSGNGSKGGGPDSLLEYLIPQTVSENTIRQGAPPAPG